jgi:hypothetical protein
MCWTPGRDVSPRVSAAAGIGCTPSERKAVMEPWLAALIIVGAAALSAAGMLLVRRRAPAGTFFNDPIPACAVYTVAGTA